MRQITKQCFDQRLRRKGIDVETLVSQGDKVQRYRGLPFWIEDPDEHERLHKETNHRCCFNHVLPTGLPRKHGEPMPMFDYEIDIHKALEKHKHVWIKKAAG